MPLPPRQVRMAEIEVRIVQALRNARRLGYEPKTFYLTPDDRAQLAEAGGQADRIEDMPVKPVGGRGRSRLYCRGGVAVNVPVLRKARRP